jgi:hypothetical protein
MHTYEVRPRKDHRGVDLISDVLPFGRLWYDTPDNQDSIFGELLLSSGYGFDSPSRVGELPSNRQLV